LLDFLKGLLPVIAAIKVTSIAQVGGEDFIPSIAVIFTVVGHIFSLFLKFKGGKGIATSAGAIMAIAPYSLIVSLVIWIILFKMSGYVSLASIVAAIFIPFLAIGANELEIHTPPISTCSLTILFVLAALVTLKHKSNIKRLMDGTESSFKKKASDAK
jgi:acyl phosphate:glycerol-3-phosphate acyltransferase